MTHPVENLPRASSGRIRQRAIAAFGCLTFLTASCAAAEEATPAQAEVSTAVISLACRSVEKSSAKDLAIALVTATAVQGSLDAYTATHAASEALSQGFCIQPYELPEGGSAVTCLVATDEADRQYTAYCLMTVRQPQ